MKNDFIMAITQLSAEKNLPKEVVFEAVEAALASAYKKDLNASANVSVKINRETGAVRVYTHKVVVEEVHNPRDEISLAEARKIRPDIEVGETVPFETVVHNAGRIAAQTAKQVVLQRLREAEREVVYDEYHGKEGDIISGVVQRVDGRQVIIDLGRTEAVLPASELPRNERLQKGQRLKVYVLEVQRAAKGPQVIVSRTHKNLIRRLFELEVPEIHRGIVEIKSIAREPGSRSKVAVWSRDPQVDPVGACVGLRGIRIQNVVNELNGERIDVVLWDPDPAKFVANALSPAKVTSVKADEATNTATVIVPDQQLSLAIGKEGQNARLAAKLTGWRIDIKAESVAMRAPEAVPAAAPETVYSAPAPSREELDEGARVPVAAAAPAAPEPVPAGPPAPPVPAPAVAAAVPQEERAPEEEKEAEAAREAAAAAPVVEEAVAEEEAAEEPVPVAPEPVRTLRGGIRFAEDLGVVPSRLPSEGKGKKGRREGRFETEEEIAARRRAGSRRRRDVYEDEDDDEYAEYTSRFR